jgi:hypothetical protein
MRWSIRMRRDEAENEDEEEVDEGWMIKR